MISGICGLIFLDFGYQLTINSIELLILETLLVLLQVYEIFKLKPKIIRDMPYYKVEPKLLMETSAYASAPTMLSMKTDLGNGPNSEKSEVQEYFQRRRHLE